MSKERKIEDPPNSFRIPHLKITKGHLEQVSLDFQSAPIQCRKYKRYNETL